MSGAVLEHVNFIVSDPSRTAEMLCDLFGWHIRWEGGSIHGGRTVHVGSADSYVAVYSKGVGSPADDSYSQLGGLNHLGVVVEDLDGVEAKVKAAGYAPHSHADYEPGRRFYFHDEDGIEYEVVSYAATEALGYAQDATPDTVPNKSASEPAMRSSRDVEKGTRWSFKPIPRNGGLLASVFGVTACLVPRTELGQ